MEIALTDLAERIGAETPGTPPPELVVRGLAALRDAGEGDLSFFHHPRYAAELKATGATAVLVPPELGADAAPEGVVLLRTESPSLAFDKAARILCADAVRPVAPGVHPSAAIGAGAEFDPAAVSIAANAVVGDGCQIGDGTRIGAGAVLGPGSVVGRDCLLHANVTLYDRTRIGDRVILHSGCVLGSDGFGFEQSGGKHEKIEHFGYVEVGDEVEIGANCTVDRGRFGRTSIGAGTKIDNLVQIGHNVVMGEHCVIVADTAIAGSARIGDHVTMAAQVGVAGHLEVGPFSVLVARTGVTKSVPGGTPEKPAFYAGFPVAPIEKNRRDTVAPRKVPDILKRLKALEAEVARLRGDGDGG